MDLNHSIPQFYNGAFYIQKQPVIDPNYKMTLELERQRRLNQFVNDIPIREGEYYSWSGSTMPIEEEEEKKD